MIFGNLTGFWQQKMLGKMHSEPERAGILGGWWVGGLDSQKSWILLTDAVKQIHGYFRGFLGFAFHHLYLVGGLVAMFYFPIYWVAFIIPIDELIFFRTGWRKTTNQIWIRFVSYKKHRGSLGGSRRQHGFQEWFFR